MHGCTNSYTVSYSAYSAIICDVAIMDTRSLGRKRKHDECDEVITNDVEVRKHMQLATTCNIDVYIGTCLHACSALQS